MTLSRSMARAARLVKPSDLPASVVDKVKIGLLDMLSCALEARTLPWGCQAIRVAQGGPASIIGTPVTASTGDAAFINATLGHGLVREDMHTGSVSHLGVVIYPVLLALAERQQVTGLDFIRAAVCGYEIGAAIGRALVDPEFVRLHRPTGTTGPLAGAAAGSILLGLEEDAMVSALGLAANTTGGLNEWPYSGGEEMFFHPGFAARNAVTAVELAALGAYASESALDGPSGLFASLHRTDRIAAIAPFQPGAWEVLSVYYKPVAACNYAQTACQAAAPLASPDIVRIHIKCSAAAVAYPGCNYTGPFDRILQARMSIQYCVAATLAPGNDSEIMRLVGATTLEADPAFTSAYPRQQGAAVTVTLPSGQTRTSRLDDLVPASPAEIRERFRLASNSTPVFDRLEHLEDVGKEFKLWTRKLTTSD